ncbi:hypothetical protein M8542_27075 [Amycolatopsis sp. OK19-0408]|uniref:DUF3558 domain-containing protein n=1 Tax=Amycolatopsis iheyensis TaxID=2945988 RepID=A0A9X2NCX3_9PSEU|nr:hypothetical protein [Amycolatopsis iheyensis]MCR6486496.1 hypothetical protein [Amycolatopsis iheyensis]
MLCALLASACAKTQAAPPEQSSGPSPLTASAALGDFASVDYCSLLDVAEVSPGATAVPTFELCRADSGGRTIQVGPLAFDSDPNLKPYGYEGPVPDGVAIQQSMFNDRSACTRAITFADGNRLDLTVTDPGAQQGARCGVADAAVGSALAAITAKKVGRLTFPERSWGRVLPCVLLDNHDLDAAAGPGSQPATGLSGHTCIRGKVSVKLTVETVEPLLAPGPPETVGGREARVRLAGAFCLVDTTQPAPGLPGRRELAEISVVETAGTANDATCALARTAAGAILPRLPQA